MGYLQQQNAMFFSDPGIEKGEFCMCPKMSITSLPIHSHRVLSDFNLCGSLKTHFEGRHVI
jgi:hypothetical protein